jgi:signal peptidase I
MDLNSSMSDASVSHTVHAGGSDRADGTKGPISGRIRQEALRQWIASGEPRTLKVSGNSMLPLLHDGDSVLIEPGAHGVRQGDIVVYFAGDLLLIHRVVRISRDPDGPVLRTKGDFTIGLDPGRIRGADLIGKVVAVDRGNTHVDLQSGSRRVLSWAVAALSYAVGLTLGGLSRQSRPSGGLNWLHLLILAAISFAIYANSIPGSFVVDDFERWQSTAWIDGRPLATVIGRSLNPTGATLYRPVPQALHAIDYRLWGTDASGFHVTNIILHTLAGWLVYLIGLTLLKKRAPAMIGALLFATHPVHTEAVTYIAGRTDLTVALFALLSFLLFLKARPPEGKPRPLIYAGSLGAFLLALMSKESAVAFPLVLVVHYLCFTRGNGKGLWRGLVLPVAPYVVLVIAYLGMRFAFADGVGAEVERVGPWIRMLTAVRTFGDYLKVLVFPADLSLRLDYPWSESFSQPGTLFQAITSAGFLSLTVWAFRKARTLSFGLLWIAICLLPVSNALAVTSKPLFAERFLYLPSAGFCFALGYLIGRLVPSAGIGRVGRRSALGAPLIVTSIVLAYSLLTVQRNRDWLSPIVFSRKTLQQNPESASARMLAHCNRGVACEDRGDYAGAIDQYKRAIASDARAFAAYRRLAAIYLDMGMVDESIEVCRHSLTIDPRQVEIHIRLGNAYLRKGMLDEAIAHYIEATKLNPALTEPYINMGVAYLRKGAPNKAIGSYTAALRLAPDFAEAHANLGNAYMAKGEVDRAIGEYRTALSLDPDFVEAHINLSRAYGAKGMLDEAIAECQEALAGNPDLVEAHINLAALYYRKGDYEAALRHCDKVAEQGDTVDPRLLELLKPYRPTGGQ